MKTFEGEIPILEVQPEGFEEIIVVKTPRGKIFQQLSEDFPRTS